MEFLKEVFANIDFHLNAQEKKLTIIYGDNRIVLQMTPDGRLQLSTNLILDGTAFGAIESPTE